MSLVIIVVIVVIVGRNTSRQGHISYISVSALFSRLYYIARH